MNDIVIEKVEKFCFLGLTMNSNITWQDHIDKISCKISKTIGIMKYLQNGIPSQTLKMIYNALVLPYLQYGILVWGFNCNRLEQQQKRCIRIISNSFPLEHTEKIFKKLRKLSKITQKWHFWHEWLSKTWLSARNQPEWYPQSRFSTYGDPFSAKFMILLQNRVFVCFSCPTQPPTWWFLLPHVSFVKRPQGFIGRSHFSAGQDFDNFRQAFWQFQSIFWPVQ